MFLSSQSLLQKMDDPKNIDESEKAPSTPETPKKLHPRHRAFIEEYFRCNMNATEAYLALYPNASRGAARRAGSRLLTSADIQAEIDRQLTKRHMGKSEVLARLSDIARASTFPFVRITPEGFVYFDFSHPDAKNYFHLIKKIKTKRTRRVEGRGESAEIWEDEWVEVELHDAQSALEKMGKYHSLFVERTDITSGGEKILVTIKNQDDTNRD